MDIVQQLQDGLRVCSSGFPGYGDQGAGGVIPPNADGLTFT